MIKQHDPGSWMNQEEIKREIKNYWQMKMKIQHTEVYGMQQTIPKAEFYSKTVLSQKSKKNLKPTI